MNARRCRFFAPLVAVLTAGAAMIASAQTLRVEVLNTRREPSSRVWGGGNWMAICVDEDARSLNMDMDTDDTVVVLIDARTATPHETRLAVDFTIADEEDDWPIAFGGDQAAIQVSEQDNGEKDLNGNGRADDSVLGLYDLTKKQWTSLGVVGARPQFLAGKLYFVRPETDAGKDLNGDGDQKDAVLCVCDIASRQIESLGMDASAGFQVAAGAVAALVRESAQGANDLNGDKDVQDAVAQVYLLADKKWTSTALESETEMALTPKLLALAVEESAQGGKDLNGDGDATDIVCQVWDIAGGTPTSTGQDCSGGLSADGSLVAFSTAESAQGNTDLNGDKDFTDEVVQVFTLGSARAKNVGRDASGGMAAGGGKVAFSCSEADNGNRDLNRDNDTADYVLMVYDPVKNSVFNSAYAADGDLNAAGGLLAWKVLEADQYDRDLNRDADTDDSILFVMDLATNTFGSTATAASEYVLITARSVGFPCPEGDQGNRDINLDQDTDDEVLQVARLKG